MADEPSFTGNPDLEAKKQQIVDRSYRLKIISGMISFGTAVVGLGLAMIAPGPGSLIAAGVIGLGGPILTTVLVEREQERLKLDRQFLETQMQGGNWGEGHWSAYRKHVMTPGQEEPVPPALAGAPPHQQSRKSKGATP